MKLLRSLSQGSEYIYTLVKLTFDETTCIETTLYQDHIGNRKHPGDEVEDPEWILRMDCFVGDCWRAKDRWKVNGNSVCSFVKSMMSLDLASEPISQTERQQYCVEMMQRLNIQRRNEDSCDLILEVGSGDDQARLKAHRNVLCAASPFFYNALNTEMKEKKEGVIRLEEASKVLMEDVLEYLYTGHVEISERNAVDLLAMADYLIIPSLRAKSCQVISQSMSHTNCLLFYYAAMRYQCTELQERTRNFIFANFMSVSTSQDFLELSRGQVEQWISRDEIKVKSEEEVFQVIVKWMEEREIGEHEEFFQLLHHVRVMYLPRSYVFNVILPHPLVKNSETCTAFLLDVTKEILNGSEEFFFDQPPRNCLKRCEDGLVTYGQHKTFFYLPSENKWYEMCNLLSPRGFGHSMSSLYGKLYLTGEGSEIEQYDPSLNTWASLKSDKGSKRSTLVSFQGSLFVVGGIVQCGQFLDNVYKYSPDTDLWQEVAPMTIARAGVCAVADRSSLYVVGGMTNNGALLNVVEKYDPEKNSWRRVASTNEKKVFSCGVIVNSKVFLFGGVINVRPLLNSTLIEMFDPVSNTWTAIQNRDSPNSFSGAVRFKGEVFTMAMGGFSDGSNRFLHVYDVDKKKLNPCSKPPVGQKLCTLAPLRIPKYTLNALQVVS